MCHIIDHISRVSCSPLFEAADTDRLSRDWDKQSWDFFCQMAVAGMTMAVLGDCNVEHGSVLKSGIANCLAAISCRWDYRFQPP